MRKNAHRESVIFVSKQNLALALSGDHRIESGELLQLSQSIYMF